VEAGDLDVMSRDTSFYYSFLVLPSRKRSAILAVWDFCRAVDDAVDEALPEDEWKGGLTPQAKARAVELLQTWRNELERIYSGSPLTPQGKALQPWAKEFNLPKPEFVTLIDGVEMDLSHANYPDFEALSNYCHKVASSVGLICVEIFGYRDPAARDYAVNLGMALQLTIIIRDVAADLKRGRIYLPMDDLAWFHVTEHDLRAGIVTPNIKSLMRYQCRRARYYYRLASERLPRIDRRNLVAAEIMGEIYFAMLRKIERARYDVFTKRIRVARPRRAIIALDIWSRALLEPKPRGARR
jgi:phytoene synthase